MAETASQPETAPEAEPGSIEHFVANRLDHQQRYFSNAASREQDLGRYWQNVSIYAAAATPLLIGIAEIADEASAWPAGLRIAALLTSGAAAVAASMIAVRGHWKTGVTYRAASEALKREKWLWQQRAGQYADSALVDPETEAESPPDAGTLRARRNERLVLKVEEIVARDVADWSERMREASSNLPSEGS